ncbi:MAG: hypothetical protein CMO80_03600 [Verrucomicrobiales bacterium]|nr:hypothetical protein [Verrucomicrobiales bacterium]|tara:strand:- start:1326 stop:2183 length:858 start_codon:yes stop_codon:yes gene_type:complete
MGQHNFPLPAGEGLRVRGEIVVFGSGVISQRIHANTSGDQPDDGMDQQLLLASFIFVIAFFVRALTGFGAGLIAIPVLALIYPLRFVVPLQLLFEVGLSFLLIKSVWKDIEWQHALSLLAGLSIGNMSGAYVLATVGDSVLKSILAVVVFLFSFYLVWTAKNPSPWNIPPKWGFVFGLSGGVFGGSLGMSGPIVVLYLSQQITEKNALRATLIGVFTFASLWTVGAHFYNGLYTEESLSMALKLVPAFLLGTVAGHWAHFRVSEVLFRRLIAGMLFVSGLLLTFA